MKMDFSNQTIFVAGAGGIGAATARNLNSLGAKIVLMDVNDDAMKDILTTLKGENRAYHCDFSDINSIEPVVKTMIKDNGAFDGFVHCVGIGAVRPLKLSKYDFMQKVMNINFFSFVEIVRCLSQKGNYSPKGMNIVGISALGAFLGNSTKTAYCASKGALNASVRCLAKELAPKNIRVNTVAPGVTDTPMAKAAEEYGAGSKEHEAILERQYLGICNPSDIADAVTFLLSNMSKKITGCCLPVDGGKLTS